jgi:hypothetical protein
VFLFTSGDHQTFNFVMYFYVLLMTNQNTKNMCLFFPFTNFFRKRFGSKTPKNDSFRQSQSSVNSSQTRVDREFSKIFLVDYHSRDSKVHVFISMPSLTSQKSSRNQKMQKKKGFFKNQLKKPVSHILETGFCYEFCLKLAIFSILCFVPHPKNDTILPIN